ncbi:MAG: HD domain-containing protein [Eubacteriales bacterium]|nr:HD domain-containing protein [Eubacteriales bacterium]
MYDKELNEALLFAAKFFIQSDQNPGKPAFLHSIRLSQLAQKMGYDKTIIVSAALHDLIEDTDCTLADIQEMWGERISEIVQSLTVQTKGISKLEAFEDSLLRSVRIGKESLIVRVLDVIDNMNYYELASEEDKKYLQKKWKYLFATAQHEIANEKAFLCFQDKLQSLGCIA